MISHYYSNIQRQAEPSSHEPNASQVFLLNNSLTSFKPMATLSEIRVPLQRFDVVVERLQCKPFTVSIPGFSPEDAVSRLTDGAKQYGYYDFVRAYAPDKKGSGS
jgi:hypothetical protein